MPQDPKRQLADLAEVQGFYLALLEKRTGEAVPVPRGVSPAEQEGTPVEQSVSVLRRWLNILDMAITPPLVRDALHGALDPAVAEALLRYYVLKTSHTDVDRDKCDFIDTRLYRGWRKQKGMSAAPAEAIEITPEHVLQYEGEIYIILGDVEPPALPEEHLQLAREFEPLRLEVDEFYHFDQLMDSGIIQRVREIKHSFMKSFYHPHVLSNVAIYNVFFGRKFDELFAQAASDIKAFAQTVTQAGGSIMTRLNDEVTVKQLTDVHEEEILHEEYGKARDKLSKVAQFKKVVDGKRKARLGAPPGAEAGPPAANVIPFVTAAAPEAAARGAVGSGSAAGAAPAPNEKAEDNKINNAADMIRNFIAAADSKTFNNIVPMRSGSLLLTPAEADAFRNPYLGEKSFRADFAEMLRRMVANMAALILELEDYTKKRDSAYLWKQHAASLKYLLAKSGRVIEEANQLRALSEKRGLGEKVKTLDATIERLRTRVHDVAKAMQA